MDDMPYHVVPLKVADCIKKSSYLLVKKNPKSKQKMMFLRSQNRESAIFETSYYTSFKTYNESIICKNKNKNKERKYFPWYKNDKINLFGCTYTNKINILGRKSRIRVGLWVWPHNQGFECLIAIDIIETYHSSHWPIWKPLQHW